MVENIPIDMLRYIIMAKTNPNEPVTRGILDEAVEAILEGVNKMFQGLEVKMTSRFDQLETKTKSNYNELKDEINGLKADLSDTPSRKEFNELKSKGEQHFPLS